ncbi:MAG: Terminase-like family protein [Glomeribacter sp. 1016415]|nr:Terminase-like family protein [Glomeribacter sp. 1016415]
MASKLPDHVVWAPLPGSQTLFLACPIFEALLEGTRGGGKTDALLMSFAQHCGKGFGEHWRGALFRLTYPQLADVVAKSKRWFYRIFPGIQFNESNYVWKWPTGEMLFFRYGSTEDDYWNYHGHEYPWLGFEELTNWRTLGFYEAMHSTCRSSFAGMPRMVRATCNPYGVGHGAVKARFKLGLDGVPPSTVIHEANQQPRVRIHSRLEENRHLLQNDPNYLPTLESIKDPNRRKAWLEGSWEIHAGAFLESVWQPQKHIVTPFPIPSTWKVWKALDWGYARPYAVYWFALDQDGCHYIWRELYGYGGKDNTGTREDAAAVAKRIKTIEEHDARLGYDYRQNLADPSIFSKIGADRSIGQIFKESGIRWQEAWNGPRSRVNGAQEIIRLLSEDRLKVFSTCKHWIRTIPALPPDHMNPEDVDSDAEDHAWDATRYGLMRRRRMPEEERASIDPEHADYHYDNNRYAFTV